MCRRDGLHRELRSTIDPVLDSRTAIQTGKRIARSRRDPNVRNENILQFNLVVDHVVIQQIRPIHAVRRVILRDDCAGRVLVADRTYQKLRAVLLAVVLQGRQESHVYRSVVLGRSDDPASGLLDALGSLLRHVRDGIVAALVHDNLCLRCRDDDAVFETNRLEMADQ